MKISIAISALILAVGAGLGWKIDGRLATTRTDERKLVAEAARIGISAGDGHPIRSTKRERVDREERTRQLAIEFNTMANIWESGVILDSALQERNRDIRQRLQSLESSQLATIIAEVLGSKDLTERSRAERAVNLLGILAEKDPQGALALFTEHYVELKIASHAESIVSDSLGSWAKVDPAAAVEWMKENPGELPEEMIKASRTGVFHSAAEKDPRLAFKLTAEFDMNGSDALHAIVTAATTDEMRNATVAALREYLGAHRDDQTASEQVDRSFGYFSWAFKPDGFEAAKQWIAGANLSPKELDSFCAGLSISSEVNEPGRWIEWMGATFPPGKGDDQIVNLISRWTRDDYEAAGKWLGAVADGPTKNAAIRGYAQTIFPQEPEVAIQWLMTVPEGEERNRMLKTLHGIWPKDDPAGKESFAKEHGIK